MLWTSVDKQANCQHPNSDFSYSHSDTSLSGKERIEQSAELCHEYVGLEGFATGGGWLGPPSVTTVVSSFILIFEPSAGGLYAGT